MTLAISSYDVGIYAAAIVFLSPLIFVSLLLAFAVGRRTTDPVIAVFGGALLAIVALWAQIYLMIVLFTNGPSSWLDIAAPLTLLSVPLAITAALIARLASLRHLSPANRE